MNEKTTLSAAVDELFASGPEALARAIEEEEARLPILGELRREVEDSGDPARRLARGPHHQRALPIP